MELDDTHFVLPYPIGITGSICLLTPLDSQVSDGFYCDLRLTIWLKCDVILFRVWGFVLAILLFISPTVVP